MDKFDEKVIGYDSIKETLRQIADVLKRPEAYKEKGVSMPRGLLMESAPGLGKSLMASILMEESGRKSFVFRRINEGNTFLGEMKDIFDVAKEEAPSILLLEDLNLYVESNSPYAPEWACLQACIDETSDADIFVIATTNDTRYMPQSLLRPGRFDYILNLNPPLGKTAEDIVSYYLCDKNLAKDSTIKDICKPAAKEPEDKRSLQELLEELNALVGLKQVKEKVHDLIVYQQVQKMRREKNLHSAKNTLHLAFTGNPGTGKTTVARIVGRIYKKIGLLSKGHFVEVSRTDLIAGYQGQTALKVKKVIEQAKGGVLFIDEAYSITENENSDSYGRECLTELTKALEDYREDLVVIVAGYTEPMRNFFESNPGLKSRFNTFIEFPDYNADELDQILCSICRKNDYVLESDASAVICEYLKKCVEEKGENFANGRLARNLYDDLVMNHARRVIKITQPTKEDLCTIVKDDFQPENQKVE